MGNLWRIAERKVIPNATEKHGFSFAIAMDGISFDWFHAIVSLWFSDVVLVFVPFYTHHFRSELVDEFLNYDPTIAVQKRNG